MELSEIVRYIHAHAGSLSGLRPDDARLELMTQLELTDDGFKVIAVGYSEFWVSMKAFMGTIFVQVHEPNFNYGSMARNQKYARAAYNQVVDTLLAA